MTLIRITEDNLDYAVSIQEELFPGESARVNYEESIDGTTDYEYFLLYEDDACVGITGIYHYPDDLDSAWLGWFGICEKYRRKHFGSEAIKLFEDMAITKGYRFARIYTDAVQNDVAIAFYKSNGYTCESYENSEDPACLEYKMLIFSKPLKGDDLVLWNDRNIHLTEQIAKQRKYIRRNVAEQLKYEMLQYEVIQG